MTLKTEILVTSEWRKSNKPPPKMGLVTVEVNVSGRRFTLSTATWQSIKRKISDKSRLREINDNVIFIEGHPDAFQAIMYYHLTGELHLPPSLCPSSFKNELEFYGIEDSTLAKCCYSKYVTYFDDDAVLKILEADESNRMNENERLNEQAGLGGWNGIRATMNLILNEPFYSKSSKGYFMLNTLLVVISLATLMAGTHPMFQRELNTDEWKSYFGDEWPTVKHMFVSPSEEPSLSEPESESYPEPETEPETVEPETTPTTEPESDPESEPTAEPESENTAEPESESTAEPESERTAKPESESTAEPESEPTAEPESENTAEPESESTAEPESENTAEPESESTAEPESESTAEPESEPTAEPESENTAEPESESTAEPESESTAEPESESTAEPESEPTAEPESEPTAEPESENTAEPESESTAEPESESTAGPDSEPTTEPESEPTTEPESELTAEPESESTAEPESENIAEPTTEPESEPTAEPGSESTVEPESEPTAGPESEFIAQPETGTKIKPELESTTKLLIESGTRKALGKTVTRAEPEVDAEPEGDTEPESEIPLPENAFVRYKYLEYSEYVCVIYFTLDLFIRCFFCMNSKGMLKSFLHWVDVFSLLVMYIRYLVEYIRPQEKYEASFVDMLHCLQVVRVFRLFRLVKNFVGFRVLLYAMRASIKELLLMSMFMIVGMLLFSTLAFFSGDPAFTSIPTSCWWSIVTMTTVGYGDMVPSTALSQMNGIICAISGICLLAVIIPIFVNYFVMFYNYSKVWGKKNAEVEGLPLVDLMHIPVDKPVAAPADVPVDAPVEQKNGVHKKVD